MSTPSLSVVIPTANSYLEKHFCLRFVLAALRIQRDVTFEVILVNDGGSDKSIEIITDQSEHSHLRIAELAPSGGNVARARNHGVSLARTEKIVFLDDDTVLDDPLALAKVDGLLNDVDFTCGANRYWTSVYWHRHVNAKQPISGALKTLRDISFLPRGVNRQVGFRDLNEFTFIGNFGGVRREIFLEVGGYDEDFRGWGLEDTDLMMRLCLAEKCYELLSERSIDAIHLTHPAAIQTDYERNAARFNNLEAERGYYFHANHFFRVYEGDGFAILSSAKG